ncbi:MAG: hypothetical protein HC785_31215 [Calothrix sp. CSU_2_0]|nr:hypothetical protein [Calothrix sp. CSU_2_0]
MKPNATVIKTSLLGFSTVFLLSSPLKTLASEVKYKYQLDVTLADNSIGRVYSCGSVECRDWAIVKVKDGKQFSAYHTTEKLRGFGGRWTDRRVKAMKICVTNGFELSDCNVVKSDTATIPNGLTIHDLSIELLYDRNGRDFRTTSFNIPSNKKPE